MLTVTLADLRFRYRQFLIAVVGAGVVFAMAVLMSGLASGFKVEINRTIDAVGADQWLLSSNSDGRITSVATFSAATVQTVAHTSGVRAANGVTFLPDEVLHSQGSSVTANVMGIGADTLGQPVPVSGHGLLSAGDMVVSSATGIRRGSAVMIGSQRFHAVGAVNDRALGGGIPMVYVSLADAQTALFNGQPVVTAIITKGVAAAVPNGLLALSPSRLVNSTLQTLSGGVSSIKSARILMWIVAIIIVSALIYVSALQRVRDFAVLKALGTSSAMLFASLCLQAVMVTLLAATVGVFLSTALTGIFDQTVAVPASAYYSLPVIAVVVGLLASLVALRRAAKADPAEAFG